METGFYKRSLRITAVLAIFWERETAFSRTMSGWDTFYMLCDSCEFCLIIMARIPARNVGRKRKSWIS